MARAGTKTSTFTFEGKRYYAYGKTKAEAESNAKVKKALLEAGKIEYKSNITVDEWAYEWLETYKYGTVSDAWYKDIERVIRRWISPAIGAKRLSSVKPADIAKLYNSNTHMSLTLGRTLVQTTRNIFDSAEANDLIPKSPARFVDAPRFVPKGTHRTITARERELTIKVADEHPEGLFFLIMLYCGLRPQEVAALKWSDFDRENKTLRVERARKTNGTIGTPKTISGVRVVPVPDVLHEKLIKLKRMPDELIVSTARGRMYTKTSQKGLWDRFKKWMDIENGAEVLNGVITETTLADDLVPYCYRHTYCTDLQDMGVPVTEAKYLMGHSSIKMTADIYTHHSENSFDDARSKMNKYHT